MDLHNELDLIRHFDNEDFYTDAEKILGATTCAMHAQQLGLRAVKQYPFSSEGKQEKSGMNGHRFIHVN